MDKPSTQGPATDATHKYVHSSTQSACVRKTNSHTCAFTNLVKTNCGQQIVYNTCACFNLWTKSWIACNICCGPKRTMAAPCLRCSSEGYGTSSTQECPSMSHGTSPQHAPKLKSHTTYDAHAHQLQHTVPAPCGEGSTVCAYKIIHVHHHKLHLHVNACVCICTCAHTHSECMHASLHAPSMMLMQITSDEPLPMPLAVMMLAQCWMMAEPATRDTAVWGTKEALQV